MIAWLALSALPLAQAGAPVEAELVLDALAAELARDVAGLSLEEAPPTWFVRYRALLLDQVDADASFGALVSSGTDPYHQLAVEWRVGTPAFDNTGMGGWQNGFRTTGLPDEPTAAAVATAAWRASDRAYKEAVEQHARKTAQVERPEDHPGDYTVAGPTTADLGRAAIGDAEALFELARRVSAAMAVDAGPHTLLRGDVAIGHEAGVELLVDTAGSRVATPRDETTVRAWAHLRTADGLLLTDERLWTVRQPSQLPPVERMAEDARAMAEALVAAADAPLLTEEYVGPVLFEGEAAADLLRYLLVPQLEGTPPDVPFDSFFGDFGGGRSGAVRLSRRVLPPGWTVDDDPTADPDHPGSFAIDAEGTWAQPVRLVEEGIVQTVLMSRTPRADVRETNGHARGGMGDRARGRAALLDVRPDRHLSARKLTRRALKLAQGYGRDHVIVVTGLQEPAVMAAEDYARFPNLDPENPSLPPPVSIVRRYADGREEPVRGAAFAGVQRFVLRDIVAAGPVVVADYLSDASGEVAAFGLTAGLPTRLRAASVLVGELELVPVAPDPRAVPAVPPPRLARP